MVLPDGFNRWGGSQYIDSPATGNYQCYLADDVLAEVDARFRTLPRRESRAVVGKSSGGFGALRLGIDRPERFSAYASHAGDCAFELCIRPDFVKTATVLDNAGGVEAFVARLESQGAPRGQGEFHATMMLGLAAAYAPSDRGSRTGGDLPFDLKTANIQEDVWLRWLAHDPLQMVEADPSAFEDARVVFLDAGRRDEYGLHFAARLLSTRLKSRGVEVHHEEFDGGHMGTSHRYESSLPFVLQALEAA